MTPAQRNVLIVAILASFVAFLDGSVVTVALPAIVADLGGGLAVQQWVVDAYLITLGSLILLAGSLSDQFGRVRILRIGLIGFGVTSLACALAPSGVLLILARGFQGAAGALLVPSSLAMIVSAFDGHARGTAIGRWTAWSGVAMLVGPLFGGVFVDLVSWRWVFGINLLPIGGAVWWLGKLPTPIGVGDRVRLDYPGATLGVVGLSATVYALIEQQNWGWTDPGVWGPLILGVSSLVGFVLVEQRSAHPMMPLALFTVHNFRLGNIATVGVYGALSLGSFAVVLFLQQVAGYGATAAGLTLIPVTLIMLALSGYFGGLARRLGPRLFMAAGPVVAAGGFLLMLRVGVPVRLWTELMPGVLLFGLGLALTVAPLTAAIMSGISTDRAGIGSAINNAIARVAGLLTIAFAGAITGGDLDRAGFHRALVATAGLLVIAGVISGIGIRNDAGASDVSDTG